MRAKILIGCVMVALAGASQATLIDRGGGMIYDDVLDITWLQDANLGGSMSEHDAAAWADSLLFGGFDDWRLASMNVNMDLNIVDCNVASEAACQDNELGYMFYYNLMGSFGDDLTGDQGPFTNIQSVHWLGAPTPNPFHSHGFSFVLGDYHVGDFDDVYGAWAVRPGDVLAAPEPSTLVLMGLGLAGVGWARRRQGGVPNICDGS